MTAPVTLPAEARLAAVAAWDVPLVHGAVVTLGAVAGRLPVWRARLAEVARTLESADCWSGPAARSAAQALYDLSAVATAVDAALHGSVAELERLRREADAAQERATEALAMARNPDGAVTPTAPSRLVETMSALVPGLAAPDPGPALDAAEAALRHADAVAAAAAEAGTALAGVGVRDAFGPADFWDLAGRISLVGPVAPPEGPSDGNPQEVAAWWAGLSAGAQLAAVRAAPATVGALNGVPAWARDRANRLLLDRARRHGTSTAATTARTVAERIAVEEAAGRPVQIHLLDLAAEEVVLVLGDLDTAEAVGVLVPGVNNSPNGDLHRLVGDARDVATAARGAGPGLDVATVVWLGYRSPDNLFEMGTRFAAWDGGPILAAALAGMAATRVASGTPLPRTTVLAHSYGTVVVDEAADAPGRLAADAVVLLGSPGMEPEGAGSLEAPEVYDAASLGDPISWSGYFGGATWARGYGSNSLPVDRFMTHSDYYDPAFPTLAAIGTVVAGVPPHD